MLKSLSANNIIGKPKKEQQTSLTRDFSIFLLDFFFFSFEKVQAGPVLGADAVSLVLSIDGARKRRRQEKVDDQAAGHPIESDRLVLLFNTNSLLRFRMSVISSDDRFPLAATERKGRKKKTCHFVETS